MNIATYKGFSAQVSFDAEDEIFFGRIADVLAIVGFHAGSLANVEIAFHEAVDDYIAAQSSLRPSEEDQ